MLKGISPLLSPELLDALYRMGHGDEIILADAHFPGESLGVPVVRADGLRIPALLDAILPLFELDSYVEAPLVMMAAVTGDSLDPAVEAVVPSSRGPPRAQDPGHRAHRPLRLLRPGPQGLRRGDDRGDGQVRQHPAEEGRDTCCKAGHCLRTEQKGLSGQRVSDERHRRDGVAPDAVAMSRGKAP